MIKSVTAIARNSKAIEAIKNDEYYFASTKQTKKTEFMFYKEKKTTVAEASKNSLLFG